jgi:hypothetical protein
VDFVHVVTAIVSAEHEQHASHKGGGVPQAWPYRAGVVGPDSLPFVRVGVEYVHVRDAALAIRPSKDQYPVVVQQRGRVERSRSRLVLGMLSLAADLAPGQCFCSHALVSNFVQGRSVATNRPHLCQAQRPGY